MEVAMQKCERCALVGFAPKIIVLAFFDGSFENFSQCRSFHHEFAIFLKEVPITILDLSNTFVVAFNILALVPIRIANIRVLFKKTMVVPMVIVQSGQIINRRHDCNLLCDAWMPSDLFCRPIINSIWLVVTINILSTIGSNNIFHFNTVLEVL